MSGYSFDLYGAGLTALGSGALWWPERQALCVSDLHLGKSERIARRGGAALPPYETRDTLARLASDLDRTGARTVICLGDSFDDPLAMQALPRQDRLWISTLQAGRRWIWIEGNHDPGPVDLSGTHLAELSLGPLQFRHIAAAEAKGEVSGHYHPKVRLRLRGRALQRPAFLLDRDRLILPAYGTYTGGLFCDRPPLADLIGDPGLAILTGAQPRAVPMPRS
ncbi:putative phosphoesterase [Cribrihabitans marinus]|uniref:Putative phosphoesterase n=1 Tax=Cribrihabitans marinus TaxID=1227549 RepID=A0A1H7AL72_9RHOB|nr:ligase-associated DNA damage response endonuclease PdeM [Cribrihabitans marinus]GGH31979.1 metallophosphoesterase [Cribrihabitans marinus]SEJ66118.1 putative phosphoesterase [Cribrihabitans marinus]